MNRNVFEQMEDELVQVLFITPGSPAICLKRSQISLALNSGRTERQLAHCDNIILSGRKKALCLG